MSVEPHVHIIGNNGNMGRRYSAIFNHLQIKHTGHDIGDLFLYKENLHQATHILICTPTQYHLDNLRFFIEEGDTRPILCEKPFINSPDDFAMLKSLMKNAKKQKTKIEMVDQYDQFNKNLPVGARLTSYDYFKTGTDGLAWDCINIIWAANGSISLSDKSAIWKCQINGNDIDFSQMDLKYIAMIEDWIAGRENENRYALIMDKHQKVLDYLDGKYSNN